MTNQEKFENHIKAVGMQENIDRIVMQIFTFNSYYGVPMEETEKLYIDYIHSEVEKLKSDTKAIDMLKSFVKFANSIWNNQNNT